MRDKLFIDTNILIYLYSNSEREKQAIVKNILFEREIEITISTQVIGEFSSILYRKYNHSIEIIKWAINDFKNNFSIRVIETGTVEKALEIMDTYKYSFWDSLIMASAIESNCTILYTEDCQHNQVVENQLRIVNPFK